LKENIKELKTESVLDKVDKLPIFTFNYKGNPEGQTCFGPMAQDWHELFPSSKPDGGIETGDMLGVCLAAIQELSKQIKIQNKTITILKTNNGRGNDP